MRNTLVLALLLALVSCGGDDSSGPDAAVPDAALPDAAGADGPIADATAVDATPPDASLPDGSLPDAAPAECAIDGDCGAHATCDLLAAPAVCRCASGYVRTATGCAWGVVPLDPGFTDPTVWTLRGGATIDPTAAGTVDPGLALVSAEASCHFAEITQSFAMPARTLAEPLVAEIWSTSLAEDWPFGAHVLLGLADGWHEVAHEAMPERLCLGDRAYGGSLRLSMTSQRVDAFPIPPFAACEAGAARFDHVQIVPAAAGECPEPGAIADPGFSDAGAWDVVADASSSVTFRPDGGAGGSASALLVFGGTGTAKVSTRLSLPSAQTLPFPAIQLRYSVEAGDPLSLSRVALGFGLHRWPLVSTAGTLVTTRFCVPPDAAGLVDRLAVGNPEWATARVVLDDVSLVSEPACGAGPLLDGGFELATTSGVRSPWRFEVYDEGERPQVVVSPVEAHGGSAFVRLVADSNCDVTAALVTAVPPRGKGGPRLSFWYRSTALGIIAFSPAGDLPAAEGWTPVSTCLGGGSGLPFSIRFTLSMNPPMLCSRTFDQQHLDIDDVELALDPACPP